MLKKAYNRQYNCKVTNLPVIVLFAYSILRAFIEFVTKLETIFLVFAEGIACVKTTDLKTAKITSQRFVK